MRAQVNADIDNHMYRGDVVNEEQNLIACVSIFKLLSDPNENRLVSDMIDPDQQILKIRIYDDTPFYDACTTFAPTRGKLRALPVVDPDGKLIGVFDDGLCSDIVRELQERDIKKAEY